jgi:hypothetical protein
MWLSDHVTLDAVIGSWISEKWLLTFRPLLVAMFASNVIDIDHAFDLGADDGHANSLALHTFHLYGGFIASVFIIAGLCFKRSRIWCVGFALGIVLHLGYDAVGAWLDYQLVPLMIISIVTVLLLPWVLGFLNTPVSAMRLWALVGAYWVVDAAQRAFFYFDFANAYLTMYSSWIVPIILLLMFCVVANSYIAKYEKLSG